MRELVMGETVLDVAGDDALTCEYRVLIRTLPPPVCCESYGIRVTLKQTGEQKEVPDITFCRGRIEELADLLLRNGVTPCTLLEVITDWL